MQTEKRMSDAYLKNVVEAALLAAARPVPVSELLQIFEEQSRPTPKEMRAITSSVAHSYSPERFADTERDVELFERVGAGRAITADAVVARALLRAFDADPPPFDELVALFERSPRTRLSL